VETRRASIGLTSGASILAGFPVHHSGHDPGAAMGAGGRAAFGF